VSAVIGPRQDRDSDSDRNRGVREGRACMLQHSSGASFQARLKHGVVEPRVPEVVYAVIRSKLPAQVLKIARPRG
jgi:hypothetical protein